MERNQKEIIRTPRLELRSYTEADRQQLLAILCNNSVKQTFMIPDFDSPEQADAFCDRLLGICARGDRFVYGICREGSLIGILNDCGTRDGAIEIGYALHPDHWGQGYATEAVRACIGALFRMGYGQVIAGFFAHNAASRRVLEKCGMKKLPQEEYIEYRGSVHHCLYYGITNG